MAVCGSFEQSKLMKQLIPILYTTILSKKKQVGSHQHQVASLNIFSEIAHKHNL